MHRQQSRFSVLKAGRFEADRHDGLRIVRLAAALLASLTLLTVAPVRADVQEAMPPDDGYDWLMLDSGEWLRGELVSLFDDEMLFDSEHFDEILIELDDIERFYSGRIYAVSIQGAGSIVGKLRIEGQRLFIQDSDSEQVYQLGRLVSVTYSAQRERDRWSGEATLGLNFRRGNADIVEYNMLLGLQRRTPNSRVLIDYIGNFNETEGEQVSNNHRVNASIDRFSGSRFFWRPFLGQYFRDPFQNISNQLTVETGAGFEITDTSRTEWDVSAGFGFNYIRYDSVQAGEERSETSPAATFGTVFDTELLDWMDYLLDFQFTLLDRASGTYQHHLLTTLSTDLVGSWDLDVSFVWDRTREPQPRADGTVPEKNDFRLLVGVTYEF